MQAQGRVSGWAGLNAVFGGLSCICAGWMEKRHRWCLPWQ